MATQCSISYILDHRIEDNTLFLKLTISNLLKCLALQAKFYDLSNNPITEWVDVAYIFGLETEIQLLLDNQTSKIEFRLYSCCSVSDPDPPLDDVPCDTIKADGPDAILNACGSTPFSITDGYVRPKDTDRLNNPFNPIMIPRNIKLTIDHNLNTCDLSVHLCSIRCIVPSPTPTPTQTNTPTPTLTPTISVTPTVTPSLTVTSTSTPTPTVTKSPGASPTPTASVTPTISVTPTLTPTRTVTPTLTRTATPTPTKTPKRKVPSDYQCCNNFARYVGCGFAPFVHISSLPAKNFSTAKTGVPIDVEEICNYKLLNFYGLSPYDVPHFGKDDNPGTAGFKRFELYTHNSYGITDTPSIDGISYLTLDLPEYSLIKIKNFNDSTSDDVRAWVEKSFRFHKLDIRDTSLPRTANNLKYIGYWEYTDIHWFPGDAMMPNWMFTPRDDTVYVVLVPC